MGSTPPSGPESGDPGELGVGGVVCGGLERVTVVVLGAAGVGKSSIIEQFVFKTFSEHYAPTSSAAAYYPPVLVNGRLYEVKLVDVPVIPYFPLDSLQEWRSHLRGLRTASAFVLVFDVSNSQSFQFVKTLHEQIVESLVHHVPIVVVSNKHDLHSDVKWRREVAHIVKKQWKSGYVECCAKCNWHVVLVFEEVMRAVVTDWAGGDHKSASHRVHHRLHHALTTTTRTTHCTIL